MRGPGRRFTSEKRISEIHEIDGVFYHSKWNGGKAHAGTVAGSANADGYFEIRINNRRVFRHTLVWEKYNGSVPDGYVIDHINGIAGDDRIENLQIVTHSENHLLGVYKPQANNTTGFNGVYRAKKGRFFARYKYNRVVHHVGTFDTAEQAAIAINEHKKLTGAPESRRNSI